MCRYLKGDRLGVRVGINTGEDVVGNVGTVQIKNYTVIGDSVNPAKRVHENAALNQNLLGASTYDLVKGNVTVGELEPFQVKGRAAVEHVFELIDLKGV